MGFARHSLGDWRVILALLRLAQSSSSYCATERFFLDLNELDASDPSQLNLQALRSSSTHFMMSDAGS